MYAPLPKRIMARRRSRCGGAMRTARRHASDRGRSGWKRPTPLSRNCGRFWVRSASASCAGANVASTPTMEFERPLVDLERQIDELKRLADDGKLSVQDEIIPLERKL